MLNEPTAKVGSVSANKGSKQHTTNKAPKMMATFSATDGIDHINIDNNRAKTELGRLLSNFANTQFQHPEYGPFASIESFWHWIRFAEPTTQAQKEMQDSIRGLWGSRARALGRKQNKGVWVENFKEEIIKAIYFKIVQNQHLYDLFVASTLPFKYYYIYGPKEIEIMADYSKWLCDGVEQIRTHLKKNGKDVPFAYKEK